MNGLCFLFCLSHSVTQPKEYAVEVWIHTEESLTLCFLNLFYIIGLDTAGQHVLVYDHSVLENVILRDQHEIWSLKDISAGRLFHLLHTFVLTALTNLGHYFFTPLGGNSVSCCYG